MDELAGPEALGLNEILTPALQCRGVERLDGRQALLKPPQHPGCLWRRAQAFLEGYFVICYVLSGNKEIAVLQDIASHLEALAGRLHHLAHVLQLLRSRHGRQQSSLLQVRQGQPHFPRQRLQAHVVLLERQELLRIEAGGSLVDALQREELDHLWLTEELRAVIQRPAEQEQ